MLVKVFVSAVLFIFLPQAVAVSQEVGSPEAAAVIAGGQRRAMEERAAWNVAKKITRTKDKITSPDESGKLPSYYQDKEVGDLSQWVTKVVSIIDANNCILTIAKDTVWLSDFPTDGLGDGMSVRIIDPIKFDGTRSYQAVSGAKRTVRVLKILTLEEQKPLDEEKAKRIAEERQRQSDKLDDFELKDGTKVRGDFVSSEKGIVTIRDVDKKELTIKITEMSPTATAKVRKLLKQKTSSRKAKD